MLLLIPINKKFEFNLVLFFSEYSGQSLIAFITLWLMHSPPAHELTQQFSICQNTLSLVKALFIDGLDPCCLPFVIVSISLPSADASLLITSSTFIQDNFVSGLTAVFSWSLRSRQPPPHHCLFQDPRSSSW